MAHCIFCGKDLPSEEHLERHLYKRHKRQLKQKESIRLFKLRNR